MAVWWFPSHPVSWVFKYILHLSLFGSWLNLMAIFPSLKKEEPLCIDNITLTIYLEWYILGKKTKIESYQHSIQIYKEM